MPNMKNDEQWWLRRGTAKSGFRYIGVNGRELKSAAVLERIRRLVIPPAWTDVHISPDPERKIQVWGYDAAGRKQYRYSTAFREKRDRRKWNRLLDVARALPMLRAATNEHLARRELDRQKVLATVVRLIARASFRAGSERYAVENKTFGICTLTKKHVRIEGENLVFEYVGKRRKDQRQVVAATPLVEILDELMKLRGQRLFQYRNGGRKPHPVQARQVNDYLREIMGAKYTSKDLRTFGGTVRAATILSDLGPPKNRTEAKRNVGLAVKLVAHELGNTPAICRKAYIHPAVLEEYEQHGHVAELERRKRVRKPKRERRVDVKEPEGLYPEELALMRFLERYG